MTELRSHTSLRGIAALSVVFSHFCVFFPIVPLLQLIGGPAVDLFFILSGFILCYVYHQPESHRPRGGWWSYHVARFARIYPIFFVVTMVMILHRAYALRYVPWEYWPFGEMALQLTPAFHWPLLFMDNWNTPLWSISVEYFCYVFIFPLTFWMRHVFRISWLAVAAIFAVQLSLYYYVRYSGMPSFQEWSGIIRGVGGFTSGVGVYYLYRCAPRLTRLAQRFNFVFLLGVVAILVWCVFSSHGNVWWLSVLFPWMVLGFTDDSTRTGRVLSHSVFHFFGDISYGMYVIHMPVFLLLGGPMILHWLGDTSYWTRVGAACSLVVLTILLSYLSFRFFEMPMRRLIRRWLSVKTAPPAKDHGMPSISSPTT